MIAEVPRIIHGPFKIPVPAPSCSALTIGQRLVKSTHALSPVDYGIVETGIGYVHSGLCHAALVNRYERAVISLRLSLNADIVVSIV